MIPLHHTVLSMRNMLWLPLSQQDTKPAFALSWRQAPINTLTHCVMLVRWCVCWCVCVCARVCYSLSIKSTRSLDRTGRIQWLQTSAAGPKQHILLTAGKSRQRATALFIHTRHTPRSIVIRQLKDRKENGRWKLSIKIQFCQYFQKWLERTTRLTEQILQIIMKTMNKQARVRNTDDLWMADHRQMQKPKSGG